MRKLCAIFAAFFVLLSGALVTRAQTTGTTIGVPPAPGVPPYAGVPPTSSVPAVPGVPPASGVPPIPDVPPSVGAQTTTEAPATTGAPTVETAQQIVAGVDKVRNPGRPFRLLNTLVDFVDGQPRDRSVLVVYAKEDPVSLQFNNVVRFVQPPRDEGKLVLLYGSKMWFYDPSSQSSVRISPQQRLIGQAADGDVVTVNLAKDYTAKLLGEEALQDADRQSRNCWHLDLTAANEDAVYSRIEYWIEKGTHYPIKAKYYSDSGRLLKIAYFHKFEVMLGSPRPTHTIIIDAVDPKLVTTMTTSDYRYQDIPDSWFQRESLPHLKVE